MNRKQFLCGMICGVVLTLTGSRLVLERLEASPESTIQDSWLYELRTYTTPEGKLDALNARFRDHTMKLFEKHGIRNVMYWTPTDKPNTLIYVIAHKSREAADASWNAFRNDPEWKRVAEETQRDGRIVSKVESVYMTATDYSPMK